MLTGCICKSCTELIFRMLRIHSTACTRTRTLGEHTANRPRGQTRILRNARGKPMAATMRTIDYRRDRHTALNPRHSPQSWLRLPPPYSDSSLEQSIVSTPTPICLPNSPFHDHGNKFSNNFRLTGKVVELTPWGIIFVIERFTVCKTTTFDDRASRRLY